MIFTFSCYYSSYSPEKLRHDTALWLITFVPFIPVHRILSVSLLLFYEAPVEVESTKAGGKAAIPFINVFPVKGQCYTDTEVEQKSHKMQQNLLVSELKAV